MAGHRIAGILGGGTLSKFRIIFDCARHRMILEPTTGQDTRSRSGK